MATCTLRLTLEAPISGLLRSIVMIYNTTSLIYGIIPV